MDVDKDMAMPGFAVEVAAAVGGSSAEKFALLKRAVKDNPSDYGAHMSLVGYLREKRPQSLDLLKAREE